MAKTTALDAAALLKRIEGRAYQDVPAVDTAATRWAHAHAEAYAISIVRRGLVKGRRETGNGAAARRNLMPRLEQRLEHLKARLDQLNDIRGGGDMAVEIAQPASEWAEEMEPAVLETLARSVRIISDDQELFEAVSINGATPQNGDIERHVVIDAWLADRRITIVARALASAVYGIVGMTIEDDGRLVEDELARTIGADRERIATRLHAIIHETVKVMLRSSGRKRTRGDDQIATTTPAETMLPDVHHRDHDKTKPATTISAVDISSWETASKTLIATPLANGQIDDLAALTSGNAVLRTLVDLLRPMIEQGGEDGSAAAEIAGSETDTPFTRMAIATCLRDGTAETKRRDILANARDMIKMVKDGGNAAKVAEFEQYAKALETPEAMPEIAREAADERFARLEPAYNATTRFLATLARKIAAGDDIEVGAHTMATGDDDRPPMPTAPLCGMVAIRDRAMFDAAADHQVKAEVKRRDQALIMMFDASAAHIEALVIQIDAQALTLAAYEQLLPGGEEQDSDLAWHIRRVVADIAARHHGNDVEEIKQIAAATRSTADDADDRLKQALGNIPLLPGPTERHQERSSVTGVMRTICQIRLSIQPGDLDNVERLTESWFTHQAQAVRRKMSFDGYDARDGWRLDHEGDNAGIHWSTRARINRGPTPSIDLTVATTQKNSASPRLPRLVRILCKAVTMTGPDGPLFADAVPIDSNAAMADFRRLATDQARELPICLFTRDEQGQYAVDPDDYAAKAAGAMHVFTMGKIRTFDLSNSWGRDMSAYHGSVRHYRQKFNPDTDSRHQHPLVLPGPNATRHLDDLLNRATAATMHRYDLTTIEQPSEEPADVVAPAPSAAVKNAITVRSFLADQASGFGGRGTQQTDEPAPPCDIAPATRPSTPTTASNKITKTSIVSAEHAAVDDLDDDDLDDEPSANKGQEDLDFSAVSFERNDPPRQPAMRAKRTATAPAAPQIEGIEPGAIAAMLAKTLTTAMAPYTEQITLMSARLGDIEKMIGDGSRGGKSRDSQAARDSEDRAAAAEEELVRERREADELLQLAESEKAEVEAENETLRQRVRDLEEQIARETPITDIDADVAAPVAAAGEAMTGTAAITHQINADDDDHDMGDTDPEARPVQLDEIPAWVRRTLAGRIVILPRCERALQKAKHDNIDRLMDAIDLLGRAYVDMKQGKEGAREQWLTGLERLRLGDTPHQKWGGAAQDGDYSIVYRGEKRALDKHIRGLDSPKDDRQLLRIYYTYDDTTNQVLIGHMPGHLSSRGR